MPYNHVRSIHVSEIKFTDETVYHFQQDAKKHVVLPNGLNLLRSLPNLQQILEFGDLGPHNKVGCVRPFKQVIYVDGKECCEVDIQPSFEEEMERRLLGLNTSSALYGHDVPLPPCLETQRKVTLGPEKAWMRKTYAINLLDENYLGLHAEHMGRIMGEAFPEAGWGFAIYRTTHDDDDGWNRALERLKDTTQARLQEQANIGWELDDLVDTLRWNVRESRDYEGATTMQVRT